MIQLQKDEQGYFIRLPDDAMIVNVNEDICVLLSNWRTLNQQIRELRDEIKDLSQEC